MHVGVISCGVDFLHLMPRATEALTCVKPDISSLPNFLKAMAAAATALGSWPLLLMLQVKE
jgi:hypothetical protein